MALKQAAASGLEGGKDRGLPNEMWEDACVARDEHMSGGMSVHLNMYDLQVQ